MQYYFKGADFSSPYSCQSRIASWLRERPSVLPLLCAGILSGLILYRSCECSHRLCEFLCASSLLCLGKCCFLEVLYHLCHLPSFLLPVPQRSLSFQGRGATWTFQLGLSAPESLNIYTSVVGFCVNYHLLAKEASLMRNVIVFY